MSKKLVIQYHESYLAMADSAAMPYAVNALKHFDSQNHDFHVFISNELVITAFRILVKENKINHKDIIVRSNFLDHLIDKDGRFISYPATFFHYDLLSRLL